MRGEPQRRAGAQARARAGPALGKAARASPRLAVTASPEDVLRRMYDAFNARDVDAVAAALHADVDWPNAWEGGRIHGRDEVRAYWARQFSAISPQVTPTGFSVRADARIAVAVHQIVRSLDGAVQAVGDVVHVYRFEDGLVRRMDVEERG